MTESTWTRRRVEKHDRLSAVARYVDGKLIEPARLRDALEGLLRPGDRVALEGDNQKQADFLSRTLAQCDPGEGPRPAPADLIGVASGTSDLFERRIAAKLDFAYAGPQSVRLAQMVEDGKVRIGAIHTYVELYARMFVDLSPTWRCCCARRPTARGNLYTGPNTEDTPTIVEATAFRDGVVVAQVNEIVDELPRVDIPGSWVDVVVVADRPFAIEPLFTRDPRLDHRGADPDGHAGDPRHLRAHHVTTLNHGIGFDTAAIELLLPTYGEKLGLRGKICRNWALNPHPTLIPAIESGWVESVHCFGSEVGMDATRAPARTCSSPDTTAACGRTACLRSSPASTRSTCSSGRRCRWTPTPTRRRSPTAGCAGFGGAPNMGHDPRGRRHSARRVAETRARRSACALRGRKLVVQMVETFQKGGMPTIVETLDAVEVGKKAGMPIAPVMIYGDDVTHVVTEEGVAYLYKAPSLKERRAAIAAIAGVTPIGLRADAARTAATAPRGVVATPEDLGIAARTPVGRCWRRAASTTSSHGPADSTIRPPSFGTGERDHLQYHRPTAPGDRPDRRSGRRRPSHRGAAHAETRAGRRIRPTQPP